MVPYIFHVSILISICYLLYEALWEQETFFQLNRWILLTCLLLSFALPWLSVPQNWAFQNGVVQEAISYQKERFFAPSEVTVDTEQPNREIKSSSKENSRPISNIISRSTSKPTATSKKTTAEAEEMLPITSVVQPMTPVATPAKSLDVWQVLTYIYFAGIAIFGINFLIQLLLILFQRLTNPIIKDGRYTIVEMNQNKAPFSFWNCIFINPTKYEWDTYNQILDHEKIHIQQGHTMDILLAELVVIVQWFNPFAWLYRKAVENNLEFLTDNKMLTKGTEPSSYQLNLLRVSVPTMPLNLTTNYNQSILKKRIAMMNVKKSSASSSWKYLLLLPLLALTVITLNPVQLIAQSAATLEEQADQPKRTTRTTTTTTTRTTSNSKKRKAQKQHTYNKNKNVNKNKNKNKVYYSQDGGTSTTTTIGTWSDEDGSVDISDGDFKLQIDDDGIIMKATSQEEGEDNNFSMEIDDDGIIMRATSQEEDEDNNFRMEINENGIRMSGRSNEKGDEGNFKLHIGEDGIIIQGNGDHEDGDGPVDIRVGDGLNLNGHLTFTDEEGNESSYDIGEGEQKDKDFKINGSASFEDDNIIVYKGKIEVDGQLLSLPTRGNWVADIENNQVCFQFMYTKHNNNNISRRTCFDINQINPRPSRNDNGTFNMQRASGTLTLKGAFENKEGFGKYTFTENSSFRSYLNGEGFNRIDEELMFHVFIADINKAYFDYLKKEGYRNISTRNLEGLAHHQLSQEIIEEYLEGMKRMNFDKPTLKELIELVIHDVSVDYMQKMGREVFNELSIENVVEAAIHDVDPRFIREINEMGFDDLSFKETVEFAIHDIDADYVKELKSSGLDLSRKQIVEAAIHDVDADYIKSLQSMGYKDLTFKDIIEFAIHDIDEDYVYALKATDLDLTRKQIVEAAIHDVDTDFIREVRSLGYDDITFRDIIQFSIHDVDAHFIQSLKQAGLKNLSKRQIVEAAIHDIDTDFLQEIEDLGFKNLSFRDIVQLGIHDVSPRDIKKFRSLGYTDLSARDMIDISIHDVDPDDVEEFEELGFKNISLRQLIELEIHNVSPSYIRKARKNGADADWSLKDYVSLKIHGRDRGRHSRSN